MKRSHLTWLSVAFVGLLMGTAAYAVATSNAKHAVFHGSDPISTQVEPTLFADVEQALHGKLGTYERDKDGRLSDPSFKLGGQTWKSGSPPIQTMAKTTCEFVDKGRHLVRIESIWGRGDPAWHFVGYGGPGGSLVITNELLALLKDRGVAVRLK